MTLDERADSQVVDNLQATAFTVARVADSIARVVSARDESSMQRAPFRVSSYHAGLSCRFAEQIEAAIMVFKAERYAATITLTQSVVMTTAALWQLFVRVDSSIKREDIRYLVRYLTRVFAAESAGRATPPADAANVMRFIQQADADYPLFQSHCEELFRFDRPEWFGTGRLYADRQEGDYRMEFHRRMSGNGELIVLMSSVLRFTALAYEHYSRELTRLMPALALLDGREATAAGLPAVIAGPAGNRADAHQRPS